MTGRLLVPLATLGAVVALLPWTTAHGSAGDLSAGGLAGVAAAVAWSSGERRAGMFAFGSVAAFLLSIATTPMAGTPALRGLAAATAPLVPAAAAGALGVRGRWLFVAVGGGLVAGLGRALFFDPFRDPECLGCRPNGLALGHVPWLASTCVVAGVLFVAVGVTFAARALPRPWGLLALAVVAVLSGYDARWTTGVVAVMTVAVVATTARAFVSRSRLRRVVAVLREGDLESVLQTRLRDPRLTVSYRLADEGVFSSADGRSAAPAAIGQVTTEIRIDHILVRVCHHPAAGSVGELEELLDGPARIALANQSLRAQLAGHELRLRESRRRLVEQWDADRRAMERDIHDSAQHLALSFALEVQQASEDPHLDEAARADLMRCLSLVRQALDELREVSHGLYPPSLESRGLTPALTTLAMYSDGNLTVGGMPGRRLPAAVERTVIALVADLAADGAALHVDAELDVDMLRVTVSGDLRQPSGSVLDRIDVLDGRIERQNGTLRAVIPCE